MKTMECILGMAAMVALCLALTACNDSGPVTNDTEFEMVLATDGTLVVRQRCRDLRSPTSDVTRIQNTIEFLVAKYEPAVFNPVADTNDPRKIMLRREIIMRGDTLDTFEETKYLDGFAGTDFHELVSNGFFYMPLVSDAESKASHNGEPVELPDEKKEGGIIVRWPTNAPSIWFRQELTPPQGVPICAWYRQYLDANRTFPWKTNDAPAETNK